MNINAAHQLSDTLWEVPGTFRPGMQVPVRLYATRKLLAAMDDAVIEQIANVAGLPGIVRYALCMPDGHRGYGFPIGGAAAFDTETGVISPGGIGFDINCGMRLAATSLTYEEVKPELGRLVDRLFEAVPSGVGSPGLMEMGRDEFRSLIEEGARWCVRHGYGTEEDMARTEAGGRLEGADASAVREETVERGERQVGTLGSGNHYLEIQVVHPADVADPELAVGLGIDRPEQVVVMFHCGSRGFGHQVASDYLKEFLQVMEPEYGIRVRDRELSCAPFRSEHGQRYFAAMKCAVNMAFANRQAILHRVREVFSEVFGRDPADLGMRQVYDVTHNTAKLERHVVDGRERELLVHRKGATRAFGPGMPDVPQAYSRLGQPVIIGGSMETGSYLLVGAETGADSFYTTAHGSGRVMGRREAKRRFNGRELKRLMKKRGIYVRNASNSGLAEEAGGAYKDIDEVVGAAEHAGLSRRVARLTPIGCVKG